MHKMKAFLFARDCSRSHPAYYSVRIPMLVWRCFNLNVTYILIIYFAHEICAIEKKNVCKMGEFSDYHLICPWNYPQFENRYIFYLKTHSILTLIWNKKKWHRIKLPFCLTELHLLVMMMINRNLSFYARYLVPVEFTGLITYQIPTVYLFIVFNNCNL